tara:strand:+ start:962 stop:3292 length:2331 start_codon:yes stop_codon:yes gene_type:complete
MAGEANIWNPRTLIAISADTKSVEEKLTAITGQTLFTITSFIYVIGTGALEIHKNGLLLTKGTDWVEQTDTTFSLTSPATAGDILVASGHVGITGTVDVRDTDIYIANYQAVRDYTGTEVTIYSQGQVTAGDTGETFFQKKTGAAPGTYVDNNVDVIRPTGGDGSVGWIRRSAPVESYLTLAAALADTKKAVLGGFFSVQDYATGNGSGVMFFKWVAAATGTADGGSYLDHGTLSLQAQQNFAANYVTIKQFGAKSGADSTTALINAIAFSLNVAMPAGNYTISSQIVYPSGLRLIGAGRGNTLLTSTVVGASTFRTTADDVVNVYFADFKMVGNNLTGASGNGHAIALIDPVAGGAWSPQGSTFERLWITGFRGTDDADRLAVRKVKSAAFGMNEPLGIVLNDILISSCGHGVFAEYTQSLRVTNCIMSECDQAGVFAYRNENMKILNCDIINSGAATTDSGYLEATLLSGIVVSARNSDFSMKGTKLKGNTAGKAAIVSIHTNGDTYEDNWVRGDATTNVPHKAFYGEDCTGLKINNNTFSPAQSNFPAQKYKTIELYNTFTSQPFTGVVKDNLFEDVSIQGIEYNILLNGDTAARAFSVDVTNNQFGDAIASSGAAVIDNDIMINTCTLSNSVIGRNYHLAPTLVTRTNCVELASATIVDTNIGPSTFNANGGAITSEYTGTKESILKVEVAYDAPSVASGASTSTTVTVTGAALGDYAEASFSSGALAGLVVTAWVSSANTVTVNLFNSAVGAIDLSNQSLRVKSVSKEAYL